MITPAQCRAGRALVDYSRDQLAEAAGVAVRTISNFESGQREPIKATKQALQVALERAGVIFLEEDGDGPGVRLRRV